MKNKNARPRCIKCGTFLFNDISIAMSYCTEHRPVLNKEYQAKFREFMREYPKQAQEDIRKLKEEHSCGREHET